MSPRRLADHHLRPYSTTPLPVPTLLYDPAYATTLLYDPAYATTHPLPYHYSPSILPLPLGSSGSQP